MQSQCKGNYQQRVCPWLPVGWDFSRSQLAKQAMKHFQTINLPSGPRYYFIGIDTWIPLVDGSKCVPTAKAKDRRRTKQVFLCVSLLLNSCPFHSRCKLQAQSLPFTGGGSASSHPLSLSLLKTSREKLQQTRPTDAAATKEAFRRNWSQSQSSSTRSRSKQAPFTIALSAMVTNGSKLPFSHTYLG